jgi:16S rRNA (uracil1498-N3)-methyltransferase
MLFVEYKVMRLHRFYIDKPLGEEIVVEIDSKEEQENTLAHQWMHVLRYASGDEVFLFSSSSLGTDFLYRITLVSKGKIVLSFVSTSANIIPRPMTLVMALVKKDTFETIARSATELGITRITPLISSRSEKKNLNFERLSSIIVEASEQSGRGSIPELVKIATFEEALELTKNTERVMGSLRAQMGSTALQNVDFSKELSLWVGPEGGWTEEEETTAQANGVTLFKFTDTVLKADTGAIALLSYLKGFPQ